MQEQGRCLDGKFLCIWSDHQTILIAEKEMDSLH